MIMLGYDTLCRRSELVALRVEDLASPFRKSAQIFIRRSKSDPYGEGRLGYVSPETLAFVQDWLQTTGITPVTSSELACGPIRSETKLCIPTQSIEF